MTIAYYNGGVRVVDLSGLAGIALGGARSPAQGMSELGFYRFANANSWSAKTPSIDPATGASTSTATTSPAASTSTASTAGGAGRQPTAAG